MPSPGSDFPAFEHSWRYFSLHATQRMSVFNFYLVLIGFLMAGLVQTFAKDFTLPALGGPLGLMIAVISLVFWRLDVRTRKLIRISEDTMLSLENGFPSAGVLEKARIFQNEYSKGTGSPFLLHSYSHCLNAVFLLFSLSGILGALASFLIYVV